METYEAFYNFYGEGYEDTLPRELVDAYDIVACLSCADGCDTLLLKQKSTGKKMVAKCYTGASTLLDQTEDARLEDIRCAALPYFVGEYKNENYRCILREYIEGVSLDQYVKGHIMTEDIARDLAIALAEAMKALHTSDPVIIHRDIKPKNIIVRDDGSLALIDFGISRVYKKEAASDTVISGTEGFAPPEQYGFMQTDLECIRDVSYIGSLYIEYTDIRDISALEGREDITYLNMIECIIDDLSPLFTMPNLATVDMSASEQYRMEELFAEYGEPTFQINYI